jgi:hypothetical protein
MEAGRKAVLEMIGEFLREAAVLVLVFGFLERIVTENLTWIWAVAVVGVSGLVLANGVLIESWRK